MSRQEFARFSTHKDTRETLARAREEGIETVWDRLAAQEPQCGYCVLGVSCRNCAMGPCRIDPFGEGPQKGVCGAGADLIVARNLGRAIAAGAAAHGDHGRDILETLHRIARGDATSYEITDVEKLRRLAAEIGIGVDARSPRELAAAVADALMEDFGTRQEELTFVRRSPEKRRALWKKVGIIPRGIDRENVEMLHRTHMGVDSDYVNVLLHGLRTSLADGWGGSMLATELSDVLFGTPSPRLSQVNLGVLREDCVNIALHGHNPLLSDVIARAAEEPELLALAREDGAKGVNLVGLCCTGNELLMRRGIPMAGNHLMQELIIATGALEMLIVDYQCIMPAIADVAKCFHTKIVTTFDKAKLPGAEHVSFDPARGMEIGREIVAKAVRNFANRVPQRVHIPSQPVTMMAGFSVEAILKALGGTPAPLVDAIKAGHIRGAVAVVGCNNPKIPQDRSHTVLIRRLIENDVLVIVTGCAAVASGKMGYMVPEAAELAGPGLRAVCRALGIPPVLHMGSCVDNTRILVLVSALANHLGVDISDLPVAAAAPEWYSEKAIAIGAYAVASGVYTVLGVEPAIFGSAPVIELLTSGLEGVTGATFDVEPDPEKAALLLREHLEQKRRALGLSAVAVMAPPVPEPDALVTH
jgi:carbon-monoxide dehydrogenase catalytic subunit